GTMNVIINAFDWTVLGWTIIHFLWQGVLIGLVTALILALVPSRLAGFRYMTACLALGVCVLTFMVTLTQLGQQTRPLEQTAGAVASEMAVLETTEITNLAPGAEAMTLDVAGLVAIAWTLGVLLMSARFIIQWRTTVRLRTGADVAIDSSWQTLFDQLKEQLGLSKGIRLLGSGMAETPMVLGWIRPVVLVPAAAFTTLTTEELKLVLLHELNHIRRMDHLINLLQGTAECVLFFHPVTWWLSNQIRNERELCCDDLTIQTMNQPRIFARALFKLETLRLEHTKSPLNTAVHATGGSLMSRINRMLESQNQARHARAAWKAPLAVALATGLTAVCLTTSMNSVDAAETVASEQDRGQKEDTTFPTAEAMRAKIGEEVRNGRMNREQAGQMMQLHRRLMMGIEDGTMSTREAQAMMNERGMAIFEAGEQEERRDRDDRGDSEEELDATIAQVERMLEAGMITPAQLVEGLRKMMSEFKRPAFTRADYAEASRKMEAMVESGEITREQMQQRLDRMRMAMGGTKSKVYTKADYMEAEKKMTAMVESGEITKPQMKQRLEEMRKAMAGEDRKAKAPSRVEYMEAEKKMAAMVKAGEMTEEQMKQRLERMKLEIERSMSKDSEPKGFSRRDYKEAQGKMMEMLEAGEITREQMQQRLDRMKAGMASDKSEAEAKGGRSIPAPPEGLTREELRDWFGRMKQRLDMAVESGRMTPEEAREMMMKIRSNMR
ncbi:MAG: hypothetical protein CMJ53_06385, partial [Planctomycetaceae bacterium]|nr:hypothetical protein [Planctomycetaceae bacterium]